MKRFSITNLLALVVAVTVYQNAYVNCACDIADIKFKLFEQQSVSLQETFVGSVDKPEAGGEIIDTIVNEGLNDIPFGGGVGSGVIGHFTNDAEYAKKIEVEREKAVTIVKEIVQHIQKYKKFEIKIDLDTFEYALKKSSTMHDLSTVDTGLYKLVKFFSDSSSPIQDDPIFGASVILPLADFVESFMKIVKLEEKRSGVSAFDPIVPCMLAQAITDYFKPTLLERLDQIDVRTDQHRFDKEGKFASMHQTLKAPFNPRISSGRGFTATHNCEM